MEPHTENEKGKNIEMDNNKTISAKKIVPLIVMFMLISTIIIALIVGNGINHVSEELAKNSEVEQNNENILAEETVADHEHNFIISDNTTCDENNHWKKCSYPGCTEISEVQAHTFGEENWPMGDSCSPNNIGSHTCTSCGYEGELKNPRNHTEVTRTVPALYSHNILCDVCKTAISKNSCTKEKDGNITKITCDNLGICRECNHDYSEPVHRGVINQNGRVECVTCGRYLGTVSNITQSYPEPFTLEFSYDFSVESTGNFDDSYIWIYSLEGMTEEEHTKYEKETENNLPTVHIEGKVSFSDTNEVKYKVSSGIFNYYASGDRFVKECYVSFNATPEQEAPVINEDIVQNDIGVTETGWAIGKEIKVSGTENFCKSVKLTLKDTNDNIYVENVSAVVTDNAWSFTFRPDIEAPDGDGKDFIVVATDNLGNTSERTFKVLKTDKRPPTITSESETEKEWTQSKDWMFIAEDEGSGDVQIKVGSEPNYISAEKDETVYSREYSFEDEVYGEEGKEVKIYFKDALGNTATQDFRVYNIDTTAPTITGYEIVNNQIVLEGNDINESLGAEGAGIVEYRYIGSSEEQDAITAEDLDSSTEPDTFDRIDLSEFGDVTYAYIVAVDGAGNISEILKVELPTYKLEVDPNGGTWRGDETTKELPGFANGAEVEIENPEREGYDFLGWTESLGTVIDNDDGTWTYTFEVGDARLTANWEMSTYEIAYTLVDEGEDESEVFYEGGENPDSYTIESEAITLNEPKRSGYTFKGWTGTDIVIGESGVMPKEVTIPRDSTGNREYTAHWQIEEYTIEYMSDGEKIEVDENPTTYTVKDTVTIENEPTKKGYTFKGWTGMGIEIGENGELPKVITINNGSVGNRTYTANWEATEYTITYNLDEGTNSTENPGVYTVEDDEITLKAPTKEGYEFKGWTGSNGTTPQTTVTIDPATVTENLTYTANWIRVYTIAYELNGGELGEGITNPAECTAESGEITLNNPTKEGYIFTGWTGSNGETQQTTVTIDPATVTENLTYTANWIRVYTIAYELNGGELGEGITNPAECTEEDEEITLNNPTKEGYIFTGWTGSNGETPQTTVTINPATVTENLTYTANWIRVYTITYELDGGELGEGITNPAECTEENGEITLNNPTKEGYIFTGWTGSNGETPQTTVTINPATVTENLTYTANWIRVYTITYELNGGELGEGITNPTKYTIESEAITLIAPTKPGYAFAGWTGTGLNTATTDVTISTGSTGDRTYTATWTKDGYTITYHLDKGTNGAGNPPTYTVDDEVILNAPTKEGYTFLGWTGTDIIIDDSGVMPKVVTIRSGSTGNREYTAHWEVIEYNITYISDGEQITVAGNPEKYTIESEEITLNEPTKDGYTFAGWTRTDIEGAGQEVTIPTGSTGNREYTAHWQATEYTITYNLEGGTIEEETEEVKVNPPKYTIEAEDITLVNPTKEGYTFLGWTGTELETVTPEVTISTGSTGAREYTAHWAERTDLSYTVNYLEKVTNKVLREQKTQGNQTFGSVITSSDEVVAITGYRYDSVDKETLEITTGENVINIYYTQKRAQVTVHHYIYNQEAETEEAKYTNVKLVEDEIKLGQEGQEYTTTKSSGVPANYTCVNEEPEGHTGTMTEDEIEVNYYYRLTTPTIENNITIGAGVETLTKENGVVTYNINYTTTIKNYIGRATIEIVDTLPASIDVDKSELAGGRYDAGRHTITWTETVNNIDTFANGNYTKNVTKAIEVVYKDQDVTEDLVNTVTGKTTTYYPEAHLNKGGQTLVEESVSGTKAVKQNYRVNFRLIKVWNDNEDSRKRRSESVTIEIRVMPNDRAITRELNKENNWTYEEKGLPKYNARGEEITYVITESETNEGDLKYYDEATINTTKTQNDEATNYTATVTNVYKLIPTDFNIEITKTGTEEITSKEDEIEYTINLKAEVEDYVGDGKVIIVDKLPYKIDLEKSNIQNGTYDNEKQTITWEEEIEDINTKTAKENYKIDITKQITLSYIDIDLTKDKMTNAVDGKVELYTTDEKDEGTTSFDTNINVNGKVVVKYLEKGTEKELASSYEIVDKIGKNYTTEKKDIPGYMYVEAINETGTIKEKDQEVVYYYETTSAKVIVHHYIYDKDKKEYTTSKLTEDEEIVGTIGQEYTTSKSNKIPANYSIVSENPEKYKGNMTKDVIEVSYYYELKDTKVEGKTETDVITEVKRDETGKPIIAEGEAIEYVVKYETKIEDYMGKSVIKVVAQLPAEIDPEKSDLKGGIYDPKTNTVTWTEEVKDIDTFKNGGFTKEITKQIKVVYKDPSKIVDLEIKANGDTVTYYPDGYLDKGGEVSTPEQIRKEGKLTVKYVDIDTNEEIIKIANVEPDNESTLGSVGTEETSKANENAQNKTYGYVITGLVGDKYETKELEIPYYVFVKNTDNTQGELKEEDTVIYYYRKLECNFEIENTVKSIKLDNENVNSTDNQLVKIDVKSSNVDKTELIVEYSIKVTNKGELAGTANVLDIIPTGYKIKNAPEYWEESRTGELETKVELEPKETKELNLTLQWDNSESNLGSKSNVAKITNVENPANFENTNTKTDTSEVTVIVAIKTGEVVSGIIIAMLVISFVICACIAVIVIRKMNKGEGINKIKSLNK